MEQTAPQSPISTTSDKKKFGFGWFKGPRIIFLVLGVVVLVEIIIAAKSLISPNKTNLGSDNQQVTTSPSVGKIALVAEKKDIKVGDTVPVSVRLSTGALPTAGADMLIKFDPKSLEASNSSVIKTGTMYPDYPVKVVDQAKGEIRISGLVSDNKKTVQGVGIFATINMKALKSGKTKVYIDWKEGSSTDTNIVEAKSAKEILAEVQDLEIEIK